MIMPAQSLNIRVNNDLFATKTSWNKIIHITVSENMYKQYSEIRQRALALTDNKHDHLFHDIHLLLLVVHIIHKENVPDANCGLKQ